MKVKINKTGEIKAVNHSKILVHFSDGTTKAYKSISELSNDLSDYEEPKLYWYILSRGEIHCIEDIDNSFDKEHKEIGNYFSTKEEAEKAVEKLKAWKRLKDKGFKFLRYQPVGEYGSVSFHLNHRLNHRLSSEEKQDLDLLFRGEEWPKS